MFLDHNDIGGPRSVQVVFHPTMIAQRAISALNYAQIVYARSKILNVDPGKPQTCSILPPLTPDGLSYNNIDPSKTYMNPDKLRDTITDFCDHLMDSANLAQGPSHPVAIKKRGFQPLLDSCQLPNGDSNPAKYKYGGTNTVDGRTWHFSPRKNNVITDQKGCPTSFSEACKPGDLSAISPTGKNGHAIDKPALQQCLSYIQNNPYTDGKDCYGQVSFFIHKSHYWGDPHECWVRAANDVSTHIDQGYSEYKVRVIKSQVECQM